MKIFAQILAIFLATICLTGGTSRADDVRMKFRGSPSEVNAQIDTVFPIGMAKAELIHLLKDRYKIGTNEMNLSHVTKTPISIDKGGKHLEINSWVTVVLDEYRSWKNLFFKTYVSAQFNFDTQDRLVLTKIFVSRGPEL